MHCIYRRLGPFLGVQNFEFQYFWGFQKEKLGGGGYEDFVDIFFCLGGGGSLLAKLDYFFFFFFGGGGVFLCILGLFLRSRYSMGIFWGVAKFQIFFLVCLICIWGKQ